jgi:hypothetical protein
MFLMDCRMLYAGDAGKGPGTHEEMGPGNGPCLKIRQQRRTAPVGTHIRAWTYRSYRFWTFTDTNVVSQYQ